MKSLKLSDCLEISQAGNLVSHPIDSMNEDKIRSKLYILGHKLENYNM